MRMATGPGLARSLLEQARPRSRPHRVVLMLLGVVAVLWSGLFVIEDRFTFGAVFVMMGLLEMAVALLPDRRR